MELLDILYTPLDLPPPPKVDVAELQSWMDDNKKIIHAVNMHAYDIQLCLCQNKKIVWPWDHSFAYYNWANQGPGWIANFDKKFPELSKYMYEVFDIPIEELGNIVILPVKTKHIGHGFLHADPGDFGLRIYLEFEHIGENKLFIQKTKLPYEHNIWPVEYPIDPNLLQPEEIECKTLSPRSCWFVNNVRAFHRTYTAVENSNRIAVIVSGTYDGEKPIMDRMKDKIIASAEKYKDYAVLW
jgi:hypothetical protein